MNNNEVLREFLEYRCGIYYWLKNLYLKEPTKEELLEMVSTCKGYSIDDTIPACEKNFISFFAGLTLEKADELYKDIKAEYAYLFLGPKKVPAPPFESVYTTKTRHMCGESAMQVKELYENVGLKIESKDNLPEDFLGYELEFMYYLAYKTIEALDNNNNNKDMAFKIFKYQLHFLENHLMVWIERFTKDIIKNTGMEYFKILAELTFEFIEEDYNNLKDIV